MRTICATVALCLASATSAHAQAPTIDGKVADPITGVVEAAYTAGGIDYTLDQTTGVFAGMLYTAEDADAMYFAFAQSVHVSDNSYGPNGIGWHMGRDHTLNDLLRSDHIKVEIVDGDGAVALSFFLDYASLNGDGEVVSLGPDGGDGAWVSGDRAHLLDSESSLVWNFQSASPLYGPRLAESPARIPENSYAAGTSPDPGAPWIYEQVYEFAISKEALGTAGYGGIRITEVHNSPIKDDGASPVPVPVLSGLKSAQPPSGSALDTGDTVTYFLTFTNVGAAALDDVVVTDMVDQNLADVVPLDGGSCSDAPCGAGDTLSWPVGSLAAGESVTVTFEATADFGGESNLIHNTARLSSSDLPSDFVTNTTEHPCLDSDGDGVCDSLDNCPDTANADQADGDADTAGDACDVCPGGDDRIDGDADGLPDACDACPADPDNDADGDEVCGDVDNCPAEANADQADRDGDGDGDVCDICPADPDNDLDGDGVCGDVDNCPAKFNADQADGDGDGDGDLCDICPADPDNDIDADGVCGDVDNCPVDANADQADGDGDGEGDLCDVCPADPDNDADGDKVCGDVDNCPADDNADQEDGDGDGDGDVCDVCPADPDNDADGDGVCGDRDNCPETTNADQADGDGDGAGDACDICPADADDDADGDGVCGDVDNCPATTNADQADGDGDGDGDVCDICPADADNDADQDKVCGDVDNCPAIANNQSDGDDDGIGDACDACPKDADNDADGDGVCGDVDNCPAAANADQADGDGDEVGDACDNCPATANADQIDRDFDGEGDACEMVAVGGFCTQTQGGWGAGARGRNVGWLRDHGFDRVFPDGLTIGDERWAHFTSSAAIEAFLPAEGVAGTLETKSVDPRRTAAGVFAGQMVALTLNVGFSAAGEFDQEAPVALGTLRLVDGPLAGLTVDELLALGNQVISGDTAALDVFGASISDLNDAVTVVNESFVDCEGDGAGLAW